MSEVTKTSYQMEENKYLDADSVHIFTKDMTLKEFAEWITNSSHLGGIEIETVAEWVDS